MVDSTILLWIGLGMSCTALAFIEYAFSRSKRMKTEAGLRMGRREKS